MRNFNRESKFGGRSRDGDRNRFGRENSPRAARRDSGRFDRRNSERSFDKEMHTVNCSQCGERCEVPFRPSGDKPVYCNNCFRKSDRPESRTNRGSSNDLEQINEKLNKIMKALNIQ